jgi:hypothetical protein
MRPQIFDALTSAAGGRGYAHIYVWRSESSVKPRLGNQGQGEASRVYQARPRRQEGLRCASSCFCCATRRCGAMLCGQDPSMLISWHGGKGSRLFPSSVDVWYHTSSTSHRWIMKDNVLGLFAFLSLGASWIHISLFHCRCRQVRGKALPPERCENLVRFINISPAQGREVRGIEGA